MWETTVVKLPVCDWYYFYWSHRTRPLDWIYAWCSPPHSHEGLCMLTVYSCDTLTELHHNRHRGRTGWADHFSAGKKKTCYKYRFVDRQKLLNFIISMNQIFVDNRYAFAFTFCYCLILFKCHFMFFPCKLGASYFIVYCHDSNNRRRLGRWLVSVLITSNQIPYTW